MIEPLICEASMRPVERIVRRLERGPVTNSEAMCVLGLSRAMTRRFMYKHVLPPRKHRLIHSSKVFINSRGENDWLYTMSYFDLSKIKHKPKIHQGFKWGCGNRGKSTRSIFKAAARDRKRLIAVNTYHSGCETELSNKYNLPVGEPIYGTSCNDILLQAIQESDNQ